MRIRLPNRARRQGSVLMVSLIVALMLGTFLFYYLYLVGTQNKLVARSQAWNASLTLAEAGVEEALAQLNPGAPVVVIDRTANGWGPLAGGFYGPMARTLSAGSYSTVYTDDKYPTIYSTGYVSVASIHATLSRVVQVATTNSPMFPGAMAARYNIDFKGNGVTTDSFDSSNPSLSTNGQYDPAKTSTNGDVASMSGVVNVGNANVYGSVLLGPTATDSIQKNGVVTGGVLNDFNYDFADVVLPQTTWLPATAGSTTINGVTYQYVFNNGGDYKISGLSGNVYVGTNSNIRLMLTGSASPGNIRVAGSGASAGHLSIYMTGPSFTLSGQSTVDGGYAANLNYFGTPGNTSISLSGNAAFTGTIYAPEAAFSLGGGGNNTYDFVGACVVNSVTMNGHFNFHFDEALLKNGPVLGFTAWSWKEI